MNKFFNKVSNSILLILVLYSFLVKNPYSKEVPSIESLRQLENNYANSGKYKEAIKIRKKIIEHYPESADAKIGKTIIARYYYLMKSFDEAISIYKEIIEQPPTEESRLDALRWVQDIYIHNLKKPEKSIEECKNFINKYPNYKYIEDVYLLLASSYIYAKDYEKVIETYQEFIEKFPKSEKIKQAMWEISSTYVYQKNYPKVIETCQKIIDKYPDTPIALLSLFRIANTYLYDLNDYEKAIDTYKKILQIAKEDNCVQMAKSAISQAYALSGKIDQAIKIYQDYLSKVSKKEEWTRGMMNLASLYFQKKEFSAGLEKLREITERYPKSKEAETAEFMIITKSREMKNYDEILQECERIIKNYPSESKVVPFAMLHKGLAYTDKKDYEKATEIYQKIIKTYPNLIYAKLARAYLKIINEYYKIGKEPSPKEVETIFEKEEIRKGVWREYLLDSL